MEKKITFPREVNEKIKEVVDKLGNLREDAGLSYNLCYDSEYESNRLDSSRYLAQEEIYGELESIFRGLLGEDSQEEDELVRG